MNILYLTFYFEPDLCAGSFRNSPIVKELSKRKELENGRIDVLTTMPNRYSSYKVDAKQNEKKGNVHIYRIPLSHHDSGLIDQILAYFKYFKQTLEIVKNTEYDIVVASSSRLFTAFLGAKIARKKKAPLFLDIRDIFRDTITDIFQNKFIVFCLNLILKRIEDYTYGYASHINLVSKGFKSYFKNYVKCDYSFYTNGIDDVFLSIKQPVKLAKETSKVRTVLYAGNIGEGQGLHHIIPQVANDLKGKFEFVIIGDGGAKGKLQASINYAACENVSLLPPMKREELISKYLLADFLLVHLNDLKAFEKVLPSKIFEYASFDIPIIAGLTGYSASFVKQNVKNHILFQPCNANELKSKLLNYNYKIEKRSKFKELYARDKIIKELVSDLISIKR